MKNDVKLSVRDRVAREQLAHDEDDVLEQSYKLKDRFHHIWSYPSRRRLDKYKSDLLTKLEGTRILDYGCGWGDSSINYYMAGADVTGIDISQRFIDAANEALSLKGFDSDRFKFVKMDAHELLFENDSFDFVVGDGILHHLDADIALSEINRVLKPSGKVILFEPLADNPLLKLFRILTPRARTVDEKPLTANDLLAYSKNNYWSAEHKFCGILEAPAAILTSVLMPATPDNFLLKFVDKLENWLVQKEILLSWNQYVLLVFKK